MAFYRMRLRIGGPMSIYNASRHETVFGPKNSGDCDLMLLGALIIVLASIGLLSLKLPFLVVLPALALIATLFASVAGVVAWTSSGRLKGNAEFAAGIFALTAVAASILGDPDQAVLFLK